MSATISPRTLRRLDIQGLDTVPVAVLAPVAPWLRLAYALCGGTVAVGVALRSPAVIGALVPVAFLGAVTSLHPFDLIYNLGIRRLTGTGPLPRRGVPARFACGLASVWLVGIGAAFAGGHDGWGVGLGAALLVPATLVSTLDICLPSMLFRALTRRPARARPAGEAA